MFRVKLILSGMLALLAVCIVAPASASASRYLLCKDVGAGNGKYKNSECKTEGGGKEWEKEPIVEGESYSIRGETIGKSKLQLGSVTIECENGPIKEGSGSFKGDGKSAWTVVFSGCYESPVKEPPCTVSVKFVIKDLLVGKPSEVVKDEIKLQKESEAVIICGELAVRYNLEGKHEQCEISKETEMALIHKIECKPPTSEEEQEEKEAEPLRFTGTWEIEVPPYFWAVE